MSPLTLASTFLQESTRMAVEQGPLFRRSLFNLDFTFITSPELVAEVADDRRFTKHVLPSLEALRELTADGLFTAYSDEPSWQVAHDVLAPAFSRSAMRRHHAVMADVAAQLVAFLGERAHEPAVEVLPAMARATFEIIARAGFGHSFGSFAGDWPHPVLTSIEQTLNHSQRVAARPPLVGGLLGRRAEERNQEAVAHLHRVVDELIGQRQCDSHCDAHGTDLLGLMLDSPLDPLHIRREVLTFLAAGHETTSGALAFVLYHLAAHPEVRSRAQAEADLVLGSGVPSFEQVTKLRYLRRVVDESLRLWPTAPGFSRMALEDTVLGGGHRMNAGDAVFVLVPALHRDPVWGEEPERFDPDRFLPERVRARPAHAYKPFGTGARACIGRQFALHQIVLLIGILLHRFDFELSPGYQLRVTEGLTLQPAGLTVELAPRPGTRA